MRQRTARHYSVALGLLLAIPLSVFFSDRSHWRTQAQPMRTCSVHQNVDWLRGAGGYF